MIDTKLMYEFAKNLVDEYEKCEAEYEEEWEEYYEDNLDWGDDGSEPDFSSCKIYEAALSALIVDDFVKDLPPKLQTTIIKECMKIKTGGNFRSAI